MQHLCVWQLQVALRAPHETLGPDCEAGEKRLLASCKPNRQLTATLTQEYIMTVRTNEQLVGQQAVVIGASMSGLLAARVLADYFRQVVVIERDTFPPLREQRQGVPQGRHAHGLLARGREVLEELFPGLTQALQAQGALLGDLAGNVRWFIEGGYHCQFSSGLESLLVSRPCLEAYVRQRLLALPNVKAVENCAAVALEATADRTRIRGVRLSPSGPDGLETCEADLVVDATGRGSLAQKWLEAIGYSRPIEEEVRIQVGYSTGIFRRQAHHLQGDKAIVIAVSPDTKCAGVMLAQEGDRWIVTLAGYFGRFAPTDLPGFVEFASQLPAPDIFDVVREAEPLSTLVPARFPANQRRRYEMLPRFPEGLLVTGDAICSFNPIYGQGMTVAAMEALALGECLAEGSQRLAAKFFRRAAKIVDNPWSIAVGNDLRIPEVEGRRSFGVHMINRYIARLHVAARRDRSAAQAFHRVANLMAPPSSLLHPRVAVSVLWGSLKVPAREAGLRVPRAVSPTKAVSRSAYTGTGA